MVGDEEYLLTTISYKQLKMISISVEGSNPYDEDFYRSINALTSCIDAQTRLEIVQLSRWPYCNHVTYSNLKPDAKQLFSTLVTLFKQPQFQCLELKAMSIFYPALPEILCTFFTASSPTSQSLKLESITIIQKNDDTPDSFMIPNFSEALTEKSLHLTNMELTPSQEALIFSYPLLRLESLILANLTSVSPSKSLERAADLLCMNKISHLKTLVLKDIIFHHPHPQGVVSLLLLSPNLHHLEIEHVDIGPGGLVASLPHEISKLKEVNVLKLVRLDLGKQSERLFHQLCVAILSLPRISSLTLDLNSNELSLHHVTVILDIWKQTCPCKKLQELILSGNDLELGLLPVANIARQFMY